MTHEELERAVIYLAGRVAATCPVCAGLGVYLSRGTDWVCTMCAPARKLMEGIPLKENDV